MALGSASVAKRNKANGGVGAGYDVTTGTNYAGSGSDSATWVSTLGAVSVGGESADGSIGEAAATTRQITGLAAGTADTDAVNVAQLRQVRTALENNKIHFYSVKSTDAGAGNYNNDGAAATNALAAGVNASATRESAIAIETT